jgi:phosphatidylinositol-3-phosphatase
MGPRIGKFSTTRSNGIRSGIVGAVALAMGLSLTVRGNATTPPNPTTTATTPNSTRPCGTTTVTPVWRHVVWIVMENKSFNQIIGSSNAPYVNSLSVRCGLATNYKAPTHPSLPNYLAMTSGSTHGITDDLPPSAHPLAGASIFSQLGGGWRALQQSMPYNCDLLNTHVYAVKHNPAAYFTNVRAVCKTQNVVLGATPDTSARFTFVTPNLCSDTHDCSIATGDKWLSSFIPKILNSSRYGNGKTTIVLTWDEDDHSSANRVATVVVAPTVPPGTRSSIAFTHYSLLRSTEGMLGLPRLNNAATASSMRRAFHL